MSSLMNYLKQEGLAATVKRAWNKAFRHADSHTVFLKVDLPEGSAEEMLGEIETLDEHNRHAFEEIKFWNFVKAEDFIGNDQQSVMMLKVGDEYVAYAAEEHGAERIIHGLGSFLLKENEGWIGPVYVCKDWRGKGYNRQLLKAQMNHLCALGATTVYTAINSQNASSLKSFQGVGFREFGAVDSRGMIMIDTDDVLRTAYMKAEGV